MKLICLHASFRSKSIDCISPFKNINQYSPNAKTRVSELNDKISNIPAMGRTNYIYR
jgi:hypothetical protein